MVRLLLQGVTLELEVSSCDPVERHRSEELWEERRPKEPLEERRLKEPLEERHPWEDQSFLERPRVLEEHHLLPLRLLLPLGLLSEVQHHLSRLSRLIN